MPDIDDVIKDANKVAGEAKEQAERAKPKRRPENVRGAKETPPKNPQESLKEEEPPKVGRKPPRRGTLEDRLAQFLAGTAMIPAAVGDNYAAYIISTRSAGMAAAWAELAKENPRVKRILEGMLEGGAWSGVAVSSAAVLIPLMSHYGMLPGAGDPFAPFYPQLPPGVTPNVHERKPKKGRAPKATTSPGPASGGGGTSASPPDNGRPTHVTVGDKIPGAGHPSSFQ